MIDIRDLVTEVAEKIGILSHVDLFIDIRNSQVSEGFQNICLAAELECKGSKQKDIFWKYCVDNKCAECGYFYLGVEGN